MFSLREVELSRRIQCFPTQRGRFYSTLLPAHPLLPVSSCWALQFPASRSFFIAYFFAPHSRMQPPVTSRPKAALRRMSFPFADRDERVSASVAFDQAKVRAEFILERKRSAFIKME